MSTEQPEVADGDPAAQKAASELGRQISDVLGESLVGLYLVGSLAAGDFEPGLSDIDLLVVVASTPPPDGVERLRAMHESFAATHSTWVDRIEAVYIAAADLRDFRSARPTFPVISPGEPFHIRSEPLPDWIEYWYLVRDLSVPFVGPPAAELIPPISRSEFLQSAGRYIAELEQRIDADLVRSAGEESYVVLTASRALYSREVGGQTSKRGAGEWLIDAHPEWATLAELALAWRGDRSPVARALHRSTRGFLAFVRARIAEGGSTDSDLGQPA